MSENLEWMKPPDGVESSHKRSIPVGCIFLVVICILLCIAGIAVTVAILIGGIP